MKKLILTFVIIYGLTGFPLGFLLACMYDTDWGIIVWIIFAIGLLTKNAIRLGKDIE